jgi:hypothetical protein
MTGNVSQRDMRIQRAIEADARLRELPMKAVNWPRIFLLPKINPWGPKEQPKAKLLELLAAHTIPMGVENKYQNTIQFFDRCMELLAAYETRADT